MTSHELLSKTNALLSGEPGKTSWKVLLPLSGSFADRADAKDDRFGMCWTATDNKCATESSNAAPANAFEEFLAMLVAGEDKPALQESGLASVYYIIAAEVLGEIVLAEDLVSAEMSRDMLGIRDARLRIKELLR